MALNIEYAPHYTWPNPAIPFREYLIHPNLRIFIIENISHNWKWLRDCSRRFQARDHFLVYCGWYHSDWFCKKDLEVFEALQLDKEKFFFLFNSEDEMRRYREAGFVGELINQNAWLDWNGPMQILPAAEKKYDAVYIARPTPFKRHHLASNVANLALVTGKLHGAREVDSLPPHVFRNHEELSPHEVCQVINQSSVGLILSEEEGACFSSSEYLLCGVPVVSTKSRGGRDYWYDVNNSIVVSASDIEVAAAVLELKSRSIDPQSIRNRHIELARSARKRFVEHLQRMFDENSVDFSAEVWFEEKYFHKLRQSENPLYASIWP
jgi:glycosyltransferase involved in cell wall biosynthesis